MAERHRKAALRRPVVMGRIKARAAQFHALRRDARAGGLIGVHRPIGKVLKAQKDCGRKDCNPADGRFEVEMREHVIRRMR